MRFNYLNLRAFGHFTDYELLFENAKNFHLFYGPNEAGKSTTLRSIHHFLYGFPQQTSDSFLHNNTKLRIEGELQNSNGKTLRFIRRKGKKNTIIDENGDALDEALLDNFLNGIAEQNFTNMFALDHVRLREGGESLLQSGGHLGESLFSAASGITMLRKVFEELEKKSAMLYKKRGSTPELNKLLKEEKELKKEIADYQLKVQVWKELERNYSEGKQKIATIIAEVKSLRTEQEKLIRVKQMLPKLAKRNELKLKLTELGDTPDFPENIVELHQEAIQRLKLANNKKTIAKDSYEQIEKEYNRIKIPQGLLDQATIIDSLYRELQSYQQHVNQVPNLEGERKQLENRVMSLMKEIDAVNANLQQIDKYRLPAAKRETIRELCRQKPLLDQAAQQIEQERKEIQEDLLEKEEQLKRIPNLPTIKQLETIIDTIKREGKLEDSLKSVMDESKQKELQINEEIKRLPGWQGTYKELMEIHIPVLTETIKRFELERSALLQRLEKTREQIVTHQEQIEESEQRIRELDALAEIPSEDKLTSVREHRDHGWQLIRTKLQTGSFPVPQTEDFANGQAIEIAYEDSVRRADNVADIMRKEAAKVGEKNKRLADIKGCQNKIHELEKMETQLQSELANWQKSWLELWEPTAIIPMTPLEMKEWLEKYEKITNMIQEVEKAQVKVAELELKIKLYKEKLINELSPFITVSEHKTLAELLTISEIEQKKINDDINKRARLEDSISGINHKINNMAFKNKDIVEKLRKWNDEWLTVIQSTNISESTPVTVAESLLKKYENCAEYYENLQTIEKEQKIVQEQIVLFEERVNNLLQSVSIELEEKATDIIVNRLYATLQQARQDKVKQTEFTNQLKKFDGTIKEAAVEIKNSEVTLEGLMKQAQCQTIAELEKVEKIFIVKKEVEEKLEAIEDDLIAQGGGRSLQDLLDEAEQFEYDQIDVELEEISRKLIEIEPVRSELEQAHGVVKKEYEEKVQGNNTAALLAEQKKESLLAKLNAVTDQYIQVKLASTLLQKGIEFYRNQNQDPILKRASNLFARLTLQSFTSLTVDYDDKDQPMLMGVRTDGAKVAINGMSDGTTDQLYLALRIASIEKYQEENEPIPFIVDDILVHFDDVRSKETLKILLELSKQTQIIFFTHHARLVEIMKEIGTDSDYQLTEIHSQDVVIV